MGDRDPAFSLSAPLPWRLSCFSSGPAPSGLQGAPRKLASLYLGTPDCGPHKWHNPIVQMGKLRHSEQVPWAQGSLGGSSSEWSKHLGLWGNKLACGYPRGWGVVRGAGCLGVFVPRGLGQAGRCSSRRGPVGPWAAAPSAARPHPGGSHGSGWGVGVLVSCFCRVGGLPSWPAVVAVRLRPELPGPGGSCGASRSFEEPSEGGLQLSCGPGPWMPASVWVSSGFPQLLYGVGWILAVFHQGPWDMMPRAPASWPSLGSQPSPFCWQPVRE